MNTIIFLHGFFASGSCEPANALREVFADRYRVLTPDLPLHPKAALDFVGQLCDKEYPDILVGNSCGAFYAQIVANEKGIPALLGNPFFMMTEFLKPRIGQHEYKSPRVNGHQELIIDEQLISEFAELEQTQFDNLNPKMKEHIYGIFGDNDTLAHFELMFLEHYPNAYHFPGAHTPTTEDINSYHAPLIGKILKTIKSKNR